MRRPAGLLIEAILFRGERKGVRQSGSCFHDRACVSACCCWDCNQRGEWHMVYSLGRVYMGRAVLVGPVAAMCVVDTSPCHCCCLDVCVHIVLQTEGCGLQLQPCSDCQAVAPAAAAHSYSPVHAPFITVPSCTAA